MTWDQYNPDAMTWTIPRENTKTDKQHTIPLSALAVAVLKDCKKLGDFVFTSSGENPFDNISRGKRELDKKTKAVRKDQVVLDFPAWKIHDLRRTVASGMAKLGVSPHIIEKVLNHSSGVISGVAAVYNRYQYTKEVGEALALWESHLCEILENR